MYYDTSVHVFCIYGRSILVDLHLGNVYNCLDYKIWLFLNNEEQPITYSLAVFFFQVMNMEFFKEDKCILMLIKDLQF